MAKFCKHCGTNIETSTCNCATTQAPVAQATTTPIIETATPVVNTTSQEAATTAQAVKDAAAQSVKDVANIINIDQEKAEQLVNNAKATTLNVFDLYKKVLKNNSAAIHTAPSPTENGNRIALAITQLLIIIIVSYMTLSPLSAFISFGTRLMASILAGITCSSLICVPAGVAFLAARKNNPTASYIDVLGVFSTATLLPCTLFVVVTLLCKINLLLGLLFAFTIAITLMVHYYEAILATTLQAKDQALRTLYLAYVATGLSLAILSILTGAIIGQQIANSIMNSVGGMMDSLMYFL